jgi:putative inorganic carbon (HCO3(-)) transporter
MTTSPPAARLESRELIADTPASLNSRASQVLGTIVFVLLLVLIVLTAIPYGTAEAWWKAFFVCAVFALTILWLIEGLLSGSWITDCWSLVLPIATLSLLSIVQTLSSGRSSVPSGAIAIAPWTAISADPYQTRFFAAQLLALMLAGIFLFRYAATDGRLRILINVVIAVAIASAIFGILRQTAQHQLGFALPLLPLDSGYGQFINKNHFAYFMEMGFGLVLGMIFGGARKREQKIIYFAALLPIWTALVLCGSRGGLVAMMAQVITAVLLSSAVIRIRNSAEPSKLLTLTQSLPVRLVLLLVLICGVAFGTLWLGGDRLATKIEDSRTEFSSDQTGSRQAAGRKEIWRATWKMFAAHPALGVGMGAYWVAVPAFHDASGTMTPQEAHNDYLELLASGGLVGFAIGLWFAVVVFIRARQNLQSASLFRRAVCFGATIGMIGVAVHSLVDFGLHLIVNALVFTTLIVIATSNPRWPNPKTPEGS